MHVIDPADGQGDVVSAVDGALEFGAVRLVEFEGCAQEVHLRVAGEVAAAFRTDLLGERSTQLEVTNRAGASELSLSLRPFEIATLMLDIVEGRKQTRDLDARRSVWAQVHRPGAGGDR